MRPSVGSIAFVLALGAAHAEAQAAHPSAESGAAASDTPADRAASGEPDAAAGAVANTSGVPAGAADEATEAPVAADAETTTAATAATDATTTATERPKVAIVVAGDPDDALVAAAVALERVLADDGAVALPADPAMRTALRGGGMSDGLDDVRAARRRLGRSESADIPVLSEIGRLVRAVLVVMVRPAGTSGVEAVAYDVSQMAFFDGALDLSAGAPERAASFVARRARVAAEGAADHAEPVDEPEVTTAAGTDGAAGSESGEAAAAPTGDPVLRWFEGNWAYIAAGVLLAGGIAFVAVVASDPGTPQPMLRFTPGGTMP